MATTPVQTAIVKKGLAINRVLINAVVSMYSGYLLFCQQSVMLACDAAVEISRGKMDGWVIRVVYLLGAIVMARPSAVLLGSYTQADETTVMVQRSEEKKGRAYHP